MADVVDIFRTYLRNIIETASEHAFNFRIDYA